MSVFDREGRELFTLRQAAARAGVAAWLLRRAVAAGDGRLPGIQLDEHQWLVTMEDVHRFLALHNENPQSRALRKGWVTRRARRVPEAGPGGSGAS